MKTMDRRIAERRHRVTEDRARRRLRRLLGLLGVALLVGLVAWLIRSPVLSIREVVATGALHSDPVAAAASVGVAPGTPTMSVSAEQVEAAVAGDPWVANVDVDVTWPGFVEINVIEHRPELALAAGDGWLYVTRQGAVVAELASAENLPRIEVAVTTGVGSTVSDPTVLGALEFAAVAWDEIGVAVVVHGDAASGLSADVAGHRVRLGRSIDMTEKAVALGALLEAGIESGSFIDLIAPRRPAVANAQPLVEGEEDGPAAGEASG